MATPGEYNPPIAHYSQINVPDYVNVGLLVGKNGRHFKSITYESGCNYIWYDKDRNVIELWGSPLSFAYATTLLETRIESLKPEHTVEELRNMIKIINECTRQNGYKVIEIEGPEWAVRDFCDASFTEFMIEEESTSGFIFCMKIVLLSDGISTTLFP